MLRPPLGRICDVQAVDLGCRESLKVSFMSIDAFKKELQAHDAFMVHCSRPVRGGEAADDSRPLYPEDLRSTIRDLTIGGVRPVSCSIIWPAHQHCYGSVGIIVMPRRVQDILNTHYTDSSYKDGVGGLGAPFSDRALSDTMANSAEYNDWTINAANVIGIYIDSRPPLQIARPMLLEGLDENARIYIGHPVVPTDIGLREVAAD